MKGILVILVLTVIVFLGFFSQSASAFTCFAGPDPWFAYRIDLDKSSLPEGVEFITKNGYVPVRAYGSLKNNGTTPLYLIEVPYPSELKYTYPNSELPPDVKPRHKLVDGKAYFYTDYHPFGYRQNAEGVNTPAAYEFIIYQEELEKMGVKITNVYEDDRPSSIFLPPAQDFSITAYHGNKQIGMKGTITYVLNEEYDPKASVKRKEACDRSLKAWEFEQAAFSIIPLFGKILLSTLAILGALLVYRTIKKKSVKKLFIIFLSILLLNVAVWALMFMI